jgi:hypothetical protein
MARPTLSRAAPRRLGIAAVAVAGALALAGPAVGAFSGGGGQPAPGAPAVESDAENAPNTQPPAGAPAVKADVAPAPNTQPPRAVTVKAGKPTTVKGPQEGRGPKVKPGGRHDNGGVNGAAGMTEIWVPSVSKLSRNR